MKILSRPSRCRELTESQCESCGTSEQAVSILLPGQWEGTGPAEREARVGYWSGMLDQDSGGGCWSRMLERKECSLHSSLQLTRGFSQGH